MSLLIKALQSVERKPAAEKTADWQLAPMEDAPARPAQAAAELMRSREDHPENRRLMILLALLVTVVLGMGGYFYVAIYMPWLFLPKPPAAPVPPPPAPSAAPVTSPAVPVTSPAGPIAPLAVAAASPRPHPPAPPQVLPQAPSQPGPAVRPVAGQPAKTQSAEAPWLKPVRNATPPSAVNEAYALLKAGRHAEAQAAYEKLALTEPDNPDVWLGLAVLADTAHRHEDAARLYARVLEKDSRNAYAQAALIALLGRSEPLAAEARLRALIAEQPAAYLHFALGNLLAGQGRWREAQQAYFEAQRLDSEVADYAFNLAVSLEHLGEAKAAADYYRRALTLAEKHGGAHFDPAQARSRLERLASP